MTIILNKYIYPLFVLLLLISILVAYIISKCVVDKSKKIVTIFGGVSNNIDSDVEYKQQVHYLALHLDKKFTYLIPNDKTGAIGYLLDTLEKTDKSQNIETTTFVRQEGESDTVNKHYKITYFDTILEFENDLLSRTDIAIFLPGGIGTNYELSYTLFVMLEKIDERLVILLNTNGAFDYIINKVEKLYIDGYLRPGVFELFKQNCIVVKSAKEIIAILNKNHDSV
jgi:hypothetical protein